MKDLGNEDLKIDYNVILYKNFLLAVLRKSEKAFE